jgi:hypothetical protein
VLKNTQPFAQYGPTENVTVTNCTLISTSAAIKIGTESVDDFRNLVFTNCVIRNSNRGLSIHLRDGGNVENVIFSNMTVETRHFHEGWWGASEPIYVTAVPRSAGSRSGPTMSDDVSMDAGVGTIRNVLFSNILCRSENGIFIMGETPECVSDIRFENVRLELRKTSRWPGDRYDLRPCEPSLQPTGAEPVGPVSDWGCKSKRETAAVFIENAAAISFRDCEVLRAPEFASAKLLESFNVQSLCTSGLSDS